MKIYLLLAFLCFGFAVAHAQSFSTKEYIVIKGQVKNFKERSFDFGISGYLDNTSKTVPVKADGSFEQKVPLQELQDIYLYLNNDVVTLFVLPGDTLTINWDQNNFQQSFTARSNKPERQSELNLAVNLKWKVWAPFESIPEKTYADKILSANEAEALINTSLNEALQLLFQHPATARTQKFIYDLFYKHQSVVDAYNERVDMKNWVITSAPDSAVLKTKDTANLFEVNSRYELIRRIDDTSFVIRVKKKAELKKELPKITLTINPENIVVMGNAHYIIPIQKDLNANAFKLSATYRSFLYHYFSFGRWKQKSSPFDQYASNKFQPVADQYFAAMTFITDPTIRDWYIAYSLKSGFGHYDFAETEKLYKLFLQTCETSYYKEAIQQVYTAFKKIRPGSPAPGFTLKNEKGQPVSLSDFRGKTVYIDFWGVGCGPCIYAIQHFIPRLHEQYKNKDVVFLNICVDVKAAEWKEALQKYKLDGVNLIAEGWTNNPVCKSYSINAIPHYVLIDQQGRIVDNNGPRPEDRVIYTTIDGLLKKK